MNFQWVVIAMKPNPHQHLTNEVSYHQKFPDLWYFKVLAKSTPGTTLVVWLLQEMNAEALGKLRILFKTTHTVAEHSHLFTDYDCICNLGERKGLNIGQTLYK